jgi:hypothetical protein
LPIHANIQLSLSFLQLPCIQPTQRWQTKVDADVIGQVLRCLAQRRFAKYVGEPTITIRMSGLIRTATIPNKGPSRSRLCVCLRTDTTRAWGDVIEVRS